MTPTLVERARGCLLGLAAGDAVGAAVEFQPRGQFEPVTDMIGGGPHELAPGQWTDDTSMALCLASSLVERGGFDAADQLRRYLAWRDDGHLSSTGRCFDIGRTTAEALARFASTGEPWCGPTAADSAGNGSLMRLAPIALRYHDDPALLRHAEDSSRTTHGAPQCLAACRFFAELLRRALAGAPRDELLFGDVAGLEAALGEAARDVALLSLARGEWRGAAEARIQSSGYVLHTLEAALWCLHRTRGFEAAVLRAANLGHDADTTAAVCGQLAGALYGEEAIPARWRLRLTLRDEIGALAERLVERRR